MRYALIIAGGSGTRLWPMSRISTPKQLIPFIEGKSLLQIAYDRLEGLVPSENRYICASHQHEKLICDTLPGFSNKQFLGEPIGRDTLNAVGFSAAVIAKQDPEAVIAVFTADHIIQPVDQFLKIVKTGFEIAESNPKALVTFGIQPSYAATAYGYLKLGQSGESTSRFVDEFKEKPDAKTAEGYLKSGQYLWNSGMFVWRASTLLECIQRYQPENYPGLISIGNAWNTPDAKTALNKIFPELKKISVDFAIMEPASKDPQMKVVAVPMPLQWLDVGSWPAFAETIPADDKGNTIGTTNHLLLETRSTLIASSDPKHLIATLGCENLIIIHTPDATLVCHRDKAENIKEIQALIKERFGSLFI